MSSENGDSTAGHYLRVAGQFKEQQCQLAIEEFIWLVDLSTRLMGLRLELLQALQSELSRSSEQNIVTELKEHLTNLIIMQVRLADRDEKVNELINQLAEGQIFNGVSVDEVTLRKAILGILQASAHVKAVADSDL